MKLSNEADFPGFVFLAFPALAAADAPDPGGPPPELVAVRRGAWDPQRLLERLAAAARRARLDPRAGRGRPPPGGQGPHGAARGVAHPAPARDDPFRSRRSNGAFQ